MDKMELEHYADAFRYVTQSVGHSKYEDLINSDEYKNASEIKKSEFRIAFGLRRSLKIDNKSKQIDE